MFVKRSIDDRASSIIFDHNMASCVQKRESLQVRRVTYVDISIVGVCRGQARYGVDVVQGGNS
jgi:hypothetical protein